MEALTILSFGAGQDSTCILYKIIYDAAFRERYVNGKLLVVMSDTGNEHPHTYRHVRYIGDLCREHGIPFHFLRSSMGYHPRTWPSLQGQFIANSTIMSMMFPRTCTDNLKIKPIYAFIDDYLGRTYYGYTDPQIAKGKQFIKRFAAQHGKIKMILGIAAGEEGRIKSSARKQLRASQLKLFTRARRQIPQWMELAIEKSYPLVELGMDRRACQQYITSTGHAVPYPSNCMMCPFLSKPEMLWLYRNLPDEFGRWVQHERRKISRSAGRRINHGVKGEKTLPEILREAIEQFGHLTNTELDEHKMSHGHCVRSSF
ncbi:adenine nucleotide alpha hydrolase family protein [Pedobacter chitinilyticus]|uniref:Phosphoadenosine phosphosulphate reductase domain-containing protein n=1 Tax=Pedobacter chitinilyticus TaxID=2233776 RepID=A0A443YVZ9_9SPHI|nr:hypothetical protein [Pedobacter chitinilyticus]RWU08182.1 hypothetical protein DPV69_07310 [Pedobacter chitinilyticus]